MDTCKITNGYNDRIEAVPEMNIVIVGHVDHGKSTVIGRLLADTGSLPEGKLEQVKELCRRTSKPFEYAFLLDALKDERSQGITIDTARCFFKTQKRKYIIIDAPGHIEFLKNMITGASRAEAALLVIDAHEGIQENSRRHGYMLSMLGIRQICVLVNKLDLIPAEERQQVYENIVAEYTDFLAKIGVTPKRFIPISAVEGYNIAQKSPELPWYDGETVLEALDDFEEPHTPDNGEFRMWVQDVYKFTAMGDSRRIIAGTVASGSLKVGDEIMFLPSGKKTTVSSIETFGSEPKDRVTAGWATGFTMSEQIYVKRGELCTVIGQEAPRTGSKIRVSLFWLGKNPLEEGREYVIKIGTARVGCRIAKITGVLNASTLDKKQSPTVEKHEVAECILRLDRPIAYDIAGKTDETGRFVILDGFDIAGGGIITAAEDDETIEKGILRRNIKWVRSHITAEKRAAWFGQKAGFLVLSGNRDTEKKTLARLLEQKLLESGKKAYFLGIGNLLYGIDADIKSDSSMIRPEERKEHIRRLAETVNLMTDAGLFLIVTAGELTTDELDILRHVSGCDNNLTVWIGESENRDFDLTLPNSDDEVLAENLKERIEKEML